MATRGNAARVLASLLVFAAGLYAAPKAAAAFKNIQEGMEAPAFRLKDTAGADVALEGYRKEKAVVVVFWATWSDRSIAELKDQLSDAQAALAEVEQELRRAEMLVEKENGSQAPVATQTLPPQHVR